MLKKVRISVPFIGVLVILMTFPAFKLSSLEEQLWPTEHCYLHSVSSDSYYQEKGNLISVSPCTVQELSCCEGRMAGRSAEQKRCLGSMYKCARKIVHIETNFQFLVKCFAAMNDEKNQHL